MNNLFLDILGVRRPRLDYVSAAVCENRVDNSSGFQFPVLLLGELSSQAKVQGVFIDFSHGIFDLTWGTVPGAICYTIYRVQDVLDPFGLYSIIAECVTDTHITITDSDPSCYVVTALLPSGIVTQVSDPICVNIPPNQPPLVCFPTPTIPCDANPDNWPLGNSGSGCPAIVWQPETPIEAVEGDDVTLGPAIVWGLIQKYEWWKDGVFFRDTTATTQNSLFLEGAVEEDSGEYRLILYPVGINCSVLQSNPVVLTVEPALCVISTGSPLSDATTSVPYSLTLATEDPLVGTPNWMVTIGSLPVGLSLDALTGEISGTPTVQGTSIFTVSVTDDERSCEKEFSLSVSGCPAFVAALAGFSFNVTAAKDPAVFRAIANSIAGVYLFDTLNNTVLNFDPFTNMNRPGCYAVTAQKFCIATGSGEIQMIDATTGFGGPTVPLGGGTSVTRIPAYNSIDDVVYYTAFNGGTNDVSIIFFNPNTNFISGATTLGPGLFGGDICFCPSPKSILINGFNGSNLIESFAIPSLAPGPSLDLSAGGYANGMVFVSSIGKVYISAIDSNPPFNAQVLEVNPTTMTVDFTFDMGSPNGGSIIGLDYNSINDRVYVVNSDYGHLQVINPVARTVVCDVTPSGSEFFQTYPSVDLASQSILVNAVNNGETHAYHH